MEKILAAVVSLLVIMSTVGAFGANFASAKALSEYRVLILKDSNAWGSPAIEDTLTDMRIPYNVSTAAALNGSTVQELVSTYDVIIIVSDQPQVFYNNLAGQMNKLENYVRVGGVLEIHAANWGWGGGVWRTPLPGNVTIVQGYSTRDYVITNNTTLYSNYASHGYFIGLPADAKVITVQAPTGSPDYGRPSTAVYTLGNGRVFVTGLTLEYSVARKGPEWQEFYREMILANLDYSKVGPQQPVPTAKGLNIMLFNFYYYVQYHRNLETYNTLHRKALEGDMDNETLTLAKMQNDTAAAYYADAGQYGPVVANFPRIYIFFDLRKAALHQKQAVKILNDAMADW